MFLKLAGQSLFSLLAQQVPPLTNPAGTLDSGI